MDQRRSSQDHNHASMTEEDEPAESFREAGGEMHPVKSVGSSRVNNHEPSKHKSSDKGEDDSPDADAEKEDEDKKKQSPEEKRKATRKKWIIFSVIALLLVIGLIIGIPVFLHARHFEETDDAFVDAHVERVGPQVAGRVVRVAVEDNQLIEPNSIVLQIDPADYTVRVATAEANVAEMSGNLAQANAQKAVAEAGVEQANADLQQTTVNRENADMQLKRNQSLSSEAVSRQRLDDLRAAALTAQANERASEKRVAAAKAQVELASSQIKAAEGQVRSAMAALDQANLNLSYATVRSTVGGRVTRRDVQAGDYIQVGQPVVSIVPNQVWITANFKESQLTDMRPGQSVDIRVDAYPDETFHGRVDSIQAGTGAAFSLLPPENATGNYVKVVQRVPVKIVFDETNSEAYKRLAPGMSVVPKARVR